MINKAAPTLGGGLTPLFINREAYPRLPLSPQQDARYAGQSPVHFVGRMLEMEMAVLALLLPEAQAARKAQLDAGRVDTVFKIGDKVLLRTKELLDAAAADIGQLRPRWDCPFTVLACLSPNAYTLALPLKMRCSATINVDRLKPFLARSTRRHHLDRLLTQGGTRVTGGPVAAGRALPGASGGEAMVIFDHFVFFQRWIRIPEL
jgi:hypothetical protein